MQKTFAFAITTFLVLFAAPAFAQDATAPAFLSVDLATLSPNAASSVASARERPTAPRYDHVVTKRRSTAMMVAGIVMSTIGTGALVVGGLYMHKGHEQEKECAEGARAARAASLNIDTGVCALATMVGYGIAAGGASFVAHGVPLIVIGSWQVEVPPNHAAAPVVDRPAKSAGLRFSF